MLPGTRFRLAAKARLRQDAPTGKWALVAPETVLMLNPSAAATVLLCDGRHTYEELVGALVLTGTPRLARPAALRPRPARAFRAVRALRRAGLVSEERLERARQRYGSADYRAAEGVMREVLGRVLAEQLDEQLHAVRCPVRLLWGAQDTAAPLAGGEHAAAVMPGAVLTVLPGVGHLVPSLAPQALRDEVVAALTATVAAQ